MDFFKILNGGIGVSMSNFDRLWAKKFSGWPETELTGLLPLTFLAEGSGLTDYRIYGTENGAGVQTENLWDSNQTVKTAGKEPYVEFILQGTYAINTFPVQSGGYLFARVFKNGEPISNVYYILAGSTRTPKIISIGTGQTLRVYDPLAAGLDRDTCISRFNDYRPVVLYSDSSTPTVPTSYIPYGYELPLTVESGEQQSNYNLYIGDSKLGAEEYLDYGEQKMYRKMNETIVANRHLDTNSGLPVAFSGRCCITSPLSVPNDYYSVFYSDANDKNIHLMYSLFNDTTLVRRRAIENGKYMSSGYTIDCTGGNKLYLGWFDPTQVESVTPADVTNIFLTTPTDPPVPFPPISTYKGENTLSSEETVGEVSVTGKIKEAP